MNFTDAVRKSMKKFSDGTMNLKELQKVTNEDILYTPEFFNDLEERMLEDDEPKGKTKKDEQDED
tara:strand:+ start:802 stop:996 length:195 start_codon:yes stop_codon:yes gene_type:complete